MQVGDLLNLVVIEVQEDQIWEGNQVLNLGDMVVLQVQEAETFLSLQEWHVR